jgi:Hint domain
MSRLQTPPTRLQSSRRNLMRMGAIAASALIARATTAAADDFDRERGRSWDWQRDGNKNRDRDTHNDHDRDNRHCFLLGTTIRTADGDKKIEDLAIGDLLPTVFGGIRPIQWIGRYRYRRSDPGKPWARNVMPIRVARSALGPNVPHANLYISEAHALLMDDLLVAAGNLVNGTTITRYKARELGELEYFHIKLERHDVIYAEGAPTETLLEVDESSGNFADYIRQNGPVTTKETPCAPLVQYGYRRGEVKSCLRSAIAPWIDRRQPADVIRDKLDARGIALLREAEFIS